MLTIDHIGYAVNNINKSKEAFIKLGYQFDELVEDHDRNIYICFGEMNGYRVELISPLSNSEDSPVDSYLKKTGPTPYHICYKSDNIEESIQQLQSEKFRVIIPLAEAIAFNGKRVVFMYNRFIGMIEIVEA